MQTGLHHSRLPGHFASHRMAVRQVMTIMESRKKRTMRGKISVTGRAAIDSAFGK